MPFCSARLTKVAVTSQDNQPDLSPNSSVPALMSVASKLIMLPVTFRAMRADIISVEKDCGVAWAGPGRGGRHKRVNC